MTKFTDLGRHIAALTCTIVVSGVLLMGAVGPAQPGVVHAVAARLA